MDRIGRGELPSTPHRPGEPLLHIFARRRLTESPAPLSIRMALVRVSQMARHLHGEVDYYDCNGDACGRQRVCHAPCVALVASLRKHLDVAHCYCLKRTHKNYAAPDLRRADRAAARPASSRASALCSELVAGFTRHTARNPATLISRFVFEKSNPVKTNAPS